MNKNIKSLLFVPAKDKMLAKIPQMNADVFIVDLEFSSLSGVIRNAFCLRSAGTLGGEGKNYQGY